MAGGREEVWDVVEAWAAVRGDRCNRDAGEGRTGDAVVATRTIRSVNPFVRFFPVRPGVLVRPESQIDLRVA